MRVITIRNLHLTPQNFGKFPDIVCQNVDLLLPSPDGRFIGSQETGFHWYDLSRERLAHIKATLESFGAAPEIEERQLNFDLADWMQSQNLKEAYQIVVKYALSTEFSVYRISPEQIQYTYSKARSATGERFASEVKQKRLNHIEWMGFSEFLETQGFWDKREWIADPEVIWLDGVSYTFEGWKDKLTKTRYGNNEPKFEKVVKFLHNLLKME